MSAILSRTTILSMMGDEEFLAGPTEATNRLWGKLAGVAESRSVQKTEFWTWRQKLLLSLTAYGPGYIDERIKRSGAGCWSADR